ncbi:MAG: hypothetical protein M3464_02970 [Chloroflexota bacterium]|nr:hypothetical protein [Chloroflexota bacterium]
MTTATQPAWLDSLAEVIDDIRRLDLKLHHDTHLEPAPSDSRDQIHTAIWSHTRLTSQGTLVAEVEYSGCLRFWRQGQERGAGSEDQPASAPFALGSGPAPVN